MTRLDIIAQGLLRPINPYANLIMGGLTAMWGAWLLIPYFSVFGRASLYSKMGDFAPEWAWGSWAFVCGLVMIASVFKGMYKTLSKAMGFAVWHWFTVAGMMWWGDWQNANSITYTFIGIYCAYIYLNIKINHVKCAHKKPSFHIYHL